MATEDPQAAAAEPVAADPAPADPDAPTPGELAQDGSEDVVGVAHDMATSAAGMVTEAALRAHDLTGDAARALYRALRDAVERVERVVKLHDEAGT